MTTHADPDGRPTIFDAPAEGLPRLVSVGRLDLNTEGLLLLTNDGGLARTLELPATGWLRRYRVRAHGRVAQDAARSAAPTASPSTASATARSRPRSIATQGSNVWLTFAIREGKNREVKNVLGHLGLAVNRLIRVSFGPFQLGDLAEGAVEEVKTRTLRDQLGERVAALAGADFSGPIAAREATSMPAPRARAEERPGRPDKSARALSGKWEAVRRRERVQRKDSRAVSDSNGTEIDPAPKGPSILPISGKPEIEGRRRGPLPRPSRPGLERHLTMMEDASIHRRGRKRRRGDPDRVGQPELARREKRRARRPARGKK